MKVIIRFRRRLVLDVLFPYFVRYIPARGYPITSSPKMLAPVAFPQLRKLRKQLMGAFPFQVLDRPLHRELWRNPNEQVHVITIDGPSIDDHFLTPRNLTQQLATAQSYISCQNRISVFRDPHQMVLAIPNRMTSTLVIFHP